MMKPTVMATWGSSTVAAPSWTMPPSLPPLGKDRDHCSILQKRQLRFRQAKPHRLRGNERGLSESKQRRRPDPVVPKSLLGFHLILHTGWHHRLG